jgi:tetratricopeptide (TPR) repeat protein
MLQLITKFFRACKTLWGFCSRFEATLRVVASLACLLLGFLVYVIGGRISTEDAGLSIAIGVVTMLFAMGFGILAAIIIAPTIARGFVGWLYDRFSYSEKYDRPAPMYSIPQGLRKNRRFEEAIEAYEQIAEDYPDELKPYLEMMDIALGELKDPDRAELIYQQGLLNFTDPNHRERLARQRSGLRLRA